MLLSEDKCVTEADIGTDIDVDHSCVNGSQLHSLIRLLLAKDPKRAKPKFSLISDYMFPGHSI